MFICASASLDKLYAALIMANGAKMEGIEAEIFFTFFGMDAINKKKYKKIKISTVGNPGMGMPTLLGAIPGMESMASMMMKKEMEKLDIPPVDEFFEILNASGVKTYACKLAMEMFKLEKKDLIDEVDDVLTIGDFYERASMGENNQIIFIS